MRASLVLKTTDLLSGRSAEILLKARLRRVGRNSVPWLERMCAPCALRAGTCVADPHFAPEAQVPRARPSRAPVDQKCSPGDSCPYIQERAAQSLLLASYTPLKLCGEAMLSEAWTVPCTVGFLIKIVSRCVKKAEIF